MKTIVFPTDFSEDAFKALEFAVKYLKSDETQFIFVNVYQIPAGAASGTFYLLEELKRQSESEMKTFIQKVNAHFSEHPLDIVDKVLQGDFETQCNAVAMQYKADCIIMGTKGASGIKEVLVGSNTVSLVSGLKVPLFVIPFHYLDIPMNQFIFTYDGNPIADVAGLLVRKFGKWFNLPVKALHVYSEPDEEIKNWNAVKTLFEGLDFSSEEQMGISLEEGLKEVVQNETGVLCMIRHKQSFWERLFNQSDSRKMVMHAKLPVLVIPE